MDVRPGKLLIIGIALGFVSLIGFMQLRHAPVDSLRPSTVSASTGFDDVSDVGNSELLPEDVHGSLPFGEVQHVTVNALVVDSVDDNETYVAPSGNFFTVGTEMLPGQTYDILLSLNNTAKVPQAIDLVADLPESLSLEIDLPKDSAKAVEIRPQSSNRWTIIIDPNAYGRGGFFDLVISAHASRFMNFEESMATFELKTPYYLPETSHMVSLVY